MKILHESAAMTCLMTAALATGITMAGCATARQTEQAETPAAATARPQTPTGDAWITAKVKSALLADADVRGLSLDVDTKDGIVTLRGTARTQAEIDEARRIAMTIEGVRDVDVRTVAIDATR